jgi:hypothetical protein
MRGSFRLHLILLLTTAFSGPALADSDPSLSQVYEAVRTGHHARRPIAMRNLARRSRRPRRNHRRQRLLRALLRARARVSAQASRAASRAVWPPELASWLERKLRIIS